MANRKASAQQPDEPAPDRLTAADVLALRRRLGLTQQAMADRLGVHKRTYIPWERGRRGTGGQKQTGFRRPTAALLERIMLEEGVTLKELRRLQKERGEE